MAPPWIVRRRRGTAAALHAPLTTSSPTLPHPSGSEPPVPALVVLNEVTGPALALGSSQGDDLVRRDVAEAEGVAICRRASGGGVVALVPSGQLWIDLVLPRSSPLWDDDIGRSFHWLGAAWARALAARLGPRPCIEVHRGPAVAPDAGRVVCFAGLGHGEVTVDGRKVVGLSQRRTRTSARFQCAAVTTWDPDLLHRLLVPEAVARVGIDLAHVAAGLAPGTPSASLEELGDELVRQLPTPARPR
ncbi:MAG: hypothetical protein ACFCVK_25195 [Acidimicrobiales bacterium]